MKSITTAFKTHIQGEVTTVCTCITIKRRDKAIFCFTEHDAPVQFQGLRFVPFYSFTRTSITTSSDLEVDGLELNGILNSNALARDDIAAGLFDFAEVEIWLVNYKSTDTGAMLMRKGWLGEVVLNQDETFYGEVRGLTQILTYRIGSQFVPECRADLGDTRCKIPLDPPVWAANFTYAEGEHVFGIIDAASSYINATLVNPSFETDATGVRRTLTGWVTYGDADGRWDLQTNAFSNPAADGSKFPFIVDTINANDSGILGIYQDWDMVADGVDVLDIDTGLCRLYFTYWAMNLFSHGSIKGRLLAIDVDGHITTIYDSGDKAYTINRWFHERIDSVLVPTDTRIIRIDMLVKKKPTEQYGGAIDGITLAINQPSGNLGGADQYGGVVFKALNAGKTGSSMPAFSSLIDDTTTDNQITWKTLASWKTIDVVASVTSNKIFAPTTLPQAAGYYDGGFIIWETGVNAGKIYDIKTWNGTSIELFLRTYRPITAGDRYVIHPGCDKLFGTCRDKFDNALNFRGEKDIPGQDAYMRTPDAQVQG